MAEREEEILTTGEAAALCGVSRSTLRRAVASGLPLGPWPFLKDGQRVRIERGVLAGIEGTLTRDSAAWRVAVNVLALHRSVAVEVDRDMIRPI